MVEEDPDRASDLRLGSRFLEAAANDLSIAPGEQNTFAEQVFRLRTDELIAFDAFESFGEPLYELQQAQNFRSTAEGRQWVAQPAAGVSFDIRDSQIGQLAGRDIKNMTVIQFFELVDQEIDRTNAPEQARTEAHGLVHRMKQGVADVGAGAGGGVLAQAIARVLGLA